VTKSVTKPIADCGLRIADYEVAEYFYFEELARSHQLFAHAAVLRVAIR